MSFSKLLCKLFATSIVFDQVLVQLAASASAASRFRTRRTEKHQSSLQTAPRQTKSSENENLVQQIRSTKEKVFQLQVLVRNQDDKAKSRLEELLKINTVGENSERTEDASSTSSRSSSTLSSSQAATFSFLEREIKKGSREIASAIEQEKNKIISKLDAGEELLENQMKNFQALLQKNFAREEENWHWFWLGERMSIEGETVIIRHDHGLKKIAAYPRGKGIFTDRRNDTAFPRVWQCSLGILCEQC